MIISITLEGLMILILLAFILGLVLGVRLVAARNSLM